MQQSSFLLSSPHSSRRVKSQAPRSHRRHTIACVLAIALIFLATFFFCTFINVTDNTQLIYDVSKVNGSTVAVQKQVEKVRSGEATPSSVIFNSTKQATSSEPIIPHRLVFTYKHNILETGEPKKFHDNVMHTISEYRSFWNEPDAQISFLTDQDCIREIQTAEPRLVQYFEKGVVGSYRADICRIAALYNSGGYYFDIDLKVVQPVPLDKTTFNFVTVHESATYMNFFQAFIASPPNHPILKQALENMWIKFQDKTKFRGNLGPVTLKAAYKSASHQVQQKTWLLHELNLQHPRNPPDIYKDLPRQVGEGCCCNFVVEDAKQQQVYFFSRIVGASGTCKHLKSPNESAKRIR